MTHCSNVTGAVTDVARVGEAARSVGALLVLDGAQRAPHGPLDVQAWAATPTPSPRTRCSVSTGAGAFWVRGDLARDLPPLLGGGEMIRRVTIERTTYASPPHRFEAGTPPIGPALGDGCRRRMAGRPRLAVRSPRTSFV